MNQADNTSDHQDIRAFMDAYLRSFQALSVPDAAKCYCTPVTLSTAQGSQTIADAAGVDRFLDAMFQGMKAQKYARSAWAKLNIHVLHERAAIVSTVVRRYDIHDQVLLDSGSTYVLMKGGTWQITHAIPHDPKAMLT